MAIRDISNVQAAQAATAAGKNSTDSLGKNEFLLLLTTQMKHQDPLSPMDNTEFTAQLAQFSSLEQLFDVNKNLNGLTQTQAPAGMASVAGFLDKEILAEGNRVLLDGEGASPIQFELEGPGDIVTVAISDTNGNPVRNISLGGRPAGANEAAWDGLDNYGNPVAPGTYRYNVLAQDSQQASVGAFTQVRGVVTGAAYENGEPFLVVGQRRVALTDVMAVKTPPPGP
ncbi:MAG: flagellar hook assembly protein FlgD [Leptospirillia bacterium]